jgi:NAD(P)H-dependent FMN reductase
MRKILTINGSASRNSSNERLIAIVGEMVADWAELDMFGDLADLPHFDPELSIGDTPGEIIELRERISAADGVFICTPEYVFSIPSRLKNMIEWCVSTTIFTDKPLGIITASANGQKGHEELQLIMRTVMAKFNDRTTLLIPGVKGKVDNDGKVNDESTVASLFAFSQALEELVRENTRP